MSYQITIIEGNLGSDPENRRTAQGKQVTSFSVAVNEGSGQDQHTEWFNCVCFEKTAELAGNLHKGERILLQGRLRTSTWKDPQGVEHRKTELRVDRLTFLTPRQQGAPQQGYQQPPQYQTPPAAPPQYQQPPQGYQPPAPPQYQAPPPVPPQYQAPPQYQQPPQGRGWNDDVHR